MAVRRKNKLTSRIAYKAKIEIIPEIIFYLLNYLSRQLRIHRRIIEWMRQHWWNKRHASE